MKIAFIKVNQELDVMEDVLKKQDMKENIYVIMN